MRGEGEREVQFSASMDDGLFVISDLSKYFLLTEGDLASIEFLEALMPEPVDVPPFRAFIIQKHILLVLIVTT